MMQINLIVKNEAGYLSLYVQTLFWTVIGQQLTGNSNIPSNRHVLPQQRPLIFILNRTLIQNIKPLDAYDAEHDECVVLRPFALTSRKSAQK